MLSASETRTFNAVDPASGEAGPPFAEASVAEIAAAASAAGAVHLAGVLRDPATRAQLLRAAAERLRAEGEWIVAACRRETGLPQGRLEGELERTWRQLELFAALVEEGDYVEAVIDPARPDARPIARPDLRRMLVPLGPVAVFGASNFPLAFGVAGGDTASALAVGCPVVAKGHPSHPETNALVAAALAQAVAACELPAGTFALLPSAGAAVGEALVEHPAIAAVAFTGSFAAGRALQRRAAARPVPIPVYAEMGSLNPLVVTPGALAARGTAIAAGLATAVTGSGGQLCTKPGLALLPAGSATDAFAAELGRLLDAAEPAVLLNAGVHARLRDGLEQLDVERVTTAAQVADVEGFRCRPVAARASTADVRARPELLQERFGPFVLLVDYASSADLLDLVELLDGQLTAAIHSAPGEQELLAVLAARLGEKAGRLVFDGFPTGVAVAHAMQHGGPFPATTTPEHTSVGTTAVRRFLRPVTWQDAPAEILPAQLRDANPLGIWRRVDGSLTRERLGKGACD